MEKKCVIRGVVHRIGAQLPIFWMECRSQPSCLLYQIRKAQPMSLLLGHSSNGGTRSGIVLPAKIEGSKDQPYMGAKD